MLGACLCVLIVVSTSHLVIAYICIKPQGDSENIILMKRLFTLALGLFAVVSVQAQSLLVGTYNVRYQNEADTQHGNGWGQRCPVICELLAYESPDIFGTQEAKVGQIHDLLKGLPEYDYIGIGRDDGHEEGEYSAIFYHKARLKKVRSGNFWLSETPDRPALGWDAACIRICTWGEFEDRKTHRRLYFFNLHLDHVGRKARTESARLVLSRIRSLAPKGAAVILTGDFNVDQNDEIYTLLTSSSLLRDSYAIAERRLAPNGTFNAFDTELKTPSRIDHIFVSPAFRVTRYAVRTDSYWTEREDATEQGSNQAPAEVRLKKHVRRAPSDHYPVFARLSYTK